MTDIAMCKGFGCPLRDKCFRFTAKPTNIQNWLLAVPYDAGTCEFYWRLNDE